MTDLEKAARQALVALEKIASYRPLTFAECSDAEAVMGIAENAIPALREALAEQPSQQEQGDSICQEDDGCPTELAVLQRFWRGQSIPYEHYPTWCKPAPVPEPCKHEPVDSEEKAGAYMEARLWEFIDMAAAWPKASPDPRTWDHVMVYAPKPAQQEPVAVVSGYYGGQCVILPIDPARIYNSNTFLYTSPQPCPTCEALARTVMLDQTSHDTHRKPTDEMVVAAARVLSDRQAAACNVDCGDMWKLHGNDFIDDARAALEAANGIREKNT